MRDELDVSCPGVDLVAACNDADLVGSRLIYFFIWSVRVKGWTFGFGVILDAVSGAISAVKGGVKKLVSRKKQEEKVAVEGPAPAGGVTEKKAGEKKAESQP